MEDLSLHILDIVENSMDAGATKVKITIRENSEDDSLILSIKDNGRGMDKETLRKATDPFFTGKRGKRFGLGIPLLAQSATESSGSFSISSELHGGTIITAAFKRSHIDRKPLGDIGATMRVLICGHPEMDYLLLYEKDDFSYIFDTEKLKADIGDVPINAPELLKLIKENINEAIGTLTKQSSR